MRYRMFICLLFLNIQKHNKREPTRQYYFFSDIVFSFAYIGRTAKAKVKIEDNIWHLGRGVDYYFFRNQAYSL